MIFWPFGLFFLYSQKPRTGDIRVRVREIMGRTVHFCPPPPVTSALSLSKYLCVRDLHASDSSVIHLALNILLSHKSNRQYSWITPDHIYQYLIRALSIFSFVYPPIFRIIILSVRFRIICSFQLGFKICITMNIYTIKDHTTNIALDWGYT